MIYTPPSNPMLIVVGFQTQFIVVILSMTKDELYSAVKRQCIMET